MERFRCGHPRTEDNAYVKHQPRYDGRSDGWVAVCKACTNERSRRRTRLVHRKKSTNATLDKRVYCWKNRDRELAKRRDRERKYPKKRDMANRIYQQLRLMAQRDGLWSPPKRPVGEIPADIVAEIQRRKEHKAWLVLRREMALSLVRSARAKPLKGFVGNHSTPTPTTSALKLKY